MILDSLDDPSFVPCRSERCRIPEIHPAHSVKIGRGRPSKSCPACGSRIIRTPGEPARCVACAWRGYFVKQKESKSARDQP